MYFSPEYRENLQRFKDCLNHKHIDRVLHNSMFYSWKVFDYEPQVLLSDAISNRELMADVQSQFHERYQFDAHVEIGTRNMLAPAFEIGSTHVQINNQSGSINFVDDVLLQGDEYPEYAHDRTAFSWKMFIRKQGCVTKKRMLRAIVEFLANGDYVQFMIKKHIEEFNTPLIFNQKISFTNPLENIHKYYRGIRGLALDIRRNKGQLKEALNVIFEEDIFPALQRDLKDDSSAFITDTMTGLLAHATLNQKQWEELYWPYLKRQMDLIIGAGKTVTIFCENTMLRFAEYFQDYPRGSLLIIVEDDDLFALRKALPNACLSGGLTTSVLGNSTPEECVNYARNLIDGLGDGFILAANKMVSFRNDCRRKNLLAISEFVHNFRW